VPNSAKTFDFRETANELVDFIRARAEGFGRTMAATPATTAQIELAVLIALGSEPQNASQILSKLTLGSAGSWQPTSGEVHRALTSLVGAGSAAETIDGDRKVYAITDAGIENLAQAAENQADAASDDATKQTGANGGRFSWIGADLKRLADCDPNFLKIAAGLAPVVSDVAQNGSREQQQLATEVLAEARRKLHAILAEG